MRALLDINVLIAILDAEHTAHETVMRWIAEHSATGWASCPITQNGCIRIMSNPGYSGPLPVADIADRLRSATRHRSHAFWPDDASLLDESLVDVTRIHGPRQLTDAYLLALVVRHDGCLVTLDAGVPLAAVKGAKPKHLVRL